MIVGDFTWDHALKKNTNICYLKYDSLKFIWAFFFEIDDLAKKAKILPPNLIINLFNSHLGVFISFEQLHLNILSKIVLSSSLE